MRLGGIIILIAGLCSASFAAQNTSGNLYFRAVQQISDGTGSIRLRARFPICTSNGNIAKQTIILNINTKNYVGIADATGNVIATDTANGGAGTQFSAKVVSRGSFIRIDAIPRRLTTVNFFGANPIALGDALVTIGVFRKPDAQTTELFYQIAFSLRFNKSNGFANGKILKHAPRLCGQAEVLDERRF